MAKIADVYFKESPWAVIEEGFDPEHGMVSESVFSQANEYMGIRGYMEETYSGKKLKGSYFNGIYECTHKKDNPYKGISDTTEFMVNSPDWLFTRIFLNQKELDLGFSKIRNFRRVLDMKTGLLTRSFIWEIEEGKEAEIKFERLLSMKNVEYAAQKIQVNPLNFTGRLQILAGIDFSIHHMNEGKNYWKNIKVQEDYISPEQDFISMTGETLDTDQKICCNILLSARGIKKGGNIRKEKKTWDIFDGTVKAGKAAVLERTVKNLVCYDKKKKDFPDALPQKAKEDLEKITFAKILRDNRIWWDRVWSKADIHIQGDPFNQQGIRFCIFQLFQTYHGAVDGSNIGAKGLTGEAYNGNAFWDTETYCLPFYLFQDPGSAKNLLHYRYKTLEEAKKRAEEMDCRGAFYPVATISGKECCNLWQHSNLQLQPSTAVAYGIWFYEKETGDREFMEDCGLEMLLEICRMLASRGDFFHNGNQYGFFGVMGPDEFQMMVNHNFYTNAMGKFTFEYTLKEVKRVFHENPEALYRVFDKVKLLRSELAEWKQMAEKMYIPYDEKTGIYEQHQGFFNLPHIEVGEIAPQEFPLYQHWSYDRIYRNDMIKQPDVLMLMLLFNQSFSKEELKKNYEYYEPRCIHESSLSPSVHSILAAQLGKNREACDFFRFATRMDLDNYNRNSSEGIHTTSIAAAWMNIVYGFGGFRSDGPVSVFCPWIPEKWNEYSFHLLLAGRNLHVKVNREYVEFNADGEGENRIIVYGKELILKDTPCRVRIPEEWRNGDGMESQQ